MKKSTLFFFVVLVAITGTNVWLTVRNGAPVQSTLPQDGLNCRQMLKYANDLSAKKLFSVAADAYADYADSCAAEVGDAAYTQLRLGELYADAGDYEFALACYYKAELLDEKVKQHTGPKIVAALEKMGKETVARAEETKRAEAAAGPSKKNGKAVARVGDMTVYEEDVLGMADELPPEMRKAAQTPQVRQMLIKQYVVQEALAQRAKRQGLDKEPIVAKMRALMEKQLLVKAVLEKEIGEKARVTDEDVRAAYDAQKERFTQPGQVSVVVVESADPVKAKAALQKKSDAVWIDESFTYIPGVGEAEAAVAEIVKLPAGGVSGVFEVGGKKYVAMVKDRKDGEPIPFDDVKERLGADLAKERQQKAMDAFVEQVFADEDVQMYTDGADGA